MQTLANLNDVIGTINLLSVKIDKKKLQSSNTSSLRVDPLFQKKKGSTKQRAKACYEVSGFLETQPMQPLFRRASQII